MPVIIIITLLLSVSCKKHEPSASDLAHAATEPLGSIPRCRIYSAKSNELDASYLTEEEFAFFYTGKKGDCKEFSVLSDYTMLFSSGTSVFEIHFLQAADITHVPALEKLVRRRADALNRYREISFDLDLIYLSPNIAEIAVFGHWVVLAATPDNHTVFTAVKNALRG